MSFLRTRFGASDSLSLCWCAAGLLVVLFGTGFVRDTLDDAGLSLDHFRPPLTPFWNALQPHWFALRLLFEMASVCGDPWQANGSQVPHLHAETNLAETSIRSRWSQQSQVIKYGSRSLFYARREVSMMRISNFQGQPEDKWKHAVRQVESAGRGLDRVLDA